jgi:hypothetical protein
MMATIIDELMITLGIDSKDAQKGMKEAENTVKGGIKNITSTLQTGLSSVSKIFSGFGAALVGAFSVGTAFSTWKEQVAELGEVSRRLHMSMEDLQGWTGAVGKFGGSASDFENSLRGLSSQLAKMAVLGRSRTGTFLQSLGIDPGELGRQRDALQVLEELAGVMEQMSPDEARAAGQALGFDSSMIMLLQQGRDGMKELIRQKKEDAIYTQEDADAVKAYNVEMGKIKKGFIGIMGVLFRTVLPAFTKVAEVVGKFVNYIRKHQTAVKAFFIMLATLITGLLLPSIMAFFSALLTNPITWVILALAALAAVIEDLIVWLEGGDSALEDFWTELFGSREDAKQLFTEIKDSVQRFVDESIPKLEEFADDVKGLVKDIRDLWTELSNSAPWETFKSGLESLGSGVLNTGTAIQGEHDMAFGAMESALNSNGESSLIGSYLGAQWQAFKDEVSNTWEWVKAQASEAIDAATEEVISVWDSFTETLSEAWESVIEAVIEVLTDFLERGKQVLDAAEKAWESFKVTAINAINSLLGPIDSIAGAIRTNLIGAIDEASARWQAFQQEVALGNAAIAASAADYSRAGSYSNTNSTEWNVTLNGVQNGDEAASRFRQGVGSRFSTNNFNPGIRG